MMGRRERGQGQFFYAFDLDEVVPTDHLVKGGRQVVASLEGVFDRRDSKISTRGIYPRSRSTPETAPASRVASTRLR